MANGPELLFAPLGGVGEIGMNLALYGIGEGGKHLDGGRHRRLVRRR